MYSQEKHNIGASDTIKDVPLKTTISTLSRKAKKFIKKLCKNGIIGEKSNNKETYEKFFSHHHPTQGKKLSERKKMHSN